MGWIVAGNSPSGLEAELAYYTHWLALFTGLLGIATVMLAGIAFSQLRDSQSVNRAYLSVEPRGLSPWRGEEQRFLGHVEVVNAGALPARQVSWFLKAEMSEDGDRKLFELPAERRGSQLVVGHGRMARGTPPVTSSGLPYCFVWGIVEYDDGYGRSRVTKFCHRYNCDRADFREKLTIDERDARQHEYGNAAD